MRRFTCLLRLLLRLLMGFGLLLIQTFRFQLYLTKATTINDLIILNHIGGLISG